MEYNITGNAYGSVGMYLGRQDALQTDMYNQSVADSRAPPLGGYASGERDGGVSLDDIPELRS